MPDSSEESGRVSALIKEDLAQMGAKVSFTSGDGFSFEKNVYMSTAENAEDHSSFKFNSRTLPDSLDDFTFRKVKYSSTGVADAVEEINWYVEDQILYRSCKTISNRADYTPASDCRKADEPVAVQMADNVTHFILNTSTPGAKDETESEVLFSYSAHATPGFTFISRETETVGNTAYNQSTISNNEVNGFRTNYNESGNLSANKRVHQFFLADILPDGATYTAGSWKTDCKELSFYPGETYTIEFNLSDIESNDNFDDLKMRIFQPGVDHLAIGLRKRADGAQITGISDFLFYPPLIHDIDAEQNTIRRMEFSIPPGSTASDDDDEDASENNGKLKACIAVTAAFYSPLANQGKLKFSNFQVLRKQDEIYHFETRAAGFNPASSTTGLTASDKEKTKALKLNLRVNKRNEVGESTLIIPIPNNGIQVTTQAED